MKRPQRREFNPRNFWADITMHYFDGGLLEKQAFSYRANNIDEVKQHCVNVAKYGGAKLKVERFVIVPRDGSSPEVVVPQ